MRSSRPSLRRNALWVSLVALFAFAAAARAEQPTADFYYLRSSLRTGDVSFIDQSTGNPTSWLWDFGDSTGGALNTSTAQNPFFIYNLPGNYTVTLTVSNNDGQSTTTRVVAVLDGYPWCRSDDATMCLNGGRFAVGADWTKPDGTTGSGHAVKLTGDSGYFWFFDEANIELVVKVLDGCSINGRDWIFAAGLTNVQVLLSVTDTWRDNYNYYPYTNPQGVAFVPIQDTGAFPALFCP